MRFHKMINIFSVIGVLFVYQVLPANGAAVGYERYRAEPRNGYDGREYDSRRQGDYMEPRYAAPKGESYLYNPSAKREAAYAQPAYSQQELQQVKNEVLADLAKKVRKLPKTKGFEGNINTYIKILNDIMKKISASNLPFRTELLSVLEGHKNAVIRSAKESTFLTEKMVFDSLGNNSGEETDLQKAFRNGMRMSGKSFELLKSMSPQKREGLSYNRDYLKILLIQMLMKNHAQCSDRAQCLNKDRQLMASIQSLLPPSAKLDEALDRYIQGLQKESSEQSVLPIILRAIQSEMDQSEWEALLKSDPMIAEEIVSDEDVWAEITKQEPDGEVILPWVDQAGEKAEQEKKKEEVAIAAQKQKAEKEQNKSAIEKKTDELKGQALNQGKEAAQNLIKGLFGGQGQGAQTGGAGQAAANALKGLFG